MNTNRTDIPASWILGVFAFFAIAGFGIQVWLALTSAAELTPAQQTLAFNAKWLFILSVGVISGFALGWISGRKP